MTLATGTRLGPYEITGTLGAGGMGEVYRGKDTRLGRAVAVKVLPDQVASAPEALARFEREARAVAALSHPNILSIHDFGTDAGRAYAVTELLEGETLRRRVDGSPMPVRKVLDYGSQIALGLAAAHEKGVIHRDLKPENIIITDDGRVKILDFGLARLEGPVAGEDLTASPTMDVGTRPGTIMGTMGYMSPEQVRGKVADARADIFSLGAVLYEMMTGKKAFAHPTPADTMSAILKEDPPSLQVAGLEIPPALQQIVHHCLE
jgi:serine/threonine protein kinase